MKMRKKLIKIRKKGCKKRIKGRD